MSGHTPGPWFAVNDGTDDEPMMSVKAARIAGREPRHVVAICATGDSPQPMENANARLIAAAPDLLESLEWYIGMSKRMGNASIAGDSQAILTLMKEFAVDYGGRGRAAVAKAKGESE